MSLLRVVARLVPVDRRSEWLREFEAEWQWSRTSRPGRWRAIRYLAGAARHALWLRLEAWHADVLRQDLRFARRALVRRPVFSSLAVLTLGVALGAASAIFGIVDGVVLQPLPFEAPDRLVAVRYQYTDTGRQNDYISIPDFLDWRTAHSFEGLAAVDWPLSVTLSGQGDSARLAAARATDDFFEVLGVAPAAGRLSAGAESSGGGATAVLSHAVWQQRFGADPLLVGRSITLDGQPHVVIGVLPAGLDLPTPADIWRTLPDASGSARRRVNLLKVFGRLDADATVGTAQAEMSTIAGRLADTYPDTNARHGVAVLSLRDAWFGDATMPMALLSAAVALLLILAVANVANLMLVRLVTREGELTLRSMLGASRFRILRQLSFESLLLTAVAGVAGLALAHAGLGVLSALLPGDLPRREQIGIDGRTVVFAVVAVFLTSVSLAATFAARAPRARFSRTREGSGDRANRRVRGALVSLQVAVATLLLVGAALLGRSVLALRAVDPGFDMRAAFAFRLSLPDEAYGETTDVLSFFDRVLPALRSTPGVRAVELTSAVPLGGAWRTTGIHARAGGDEVASGFLAVTGGYFRAVGTRLVDGRTFGPADVDGAPQVAVVDETLASALWPGGRAVGQQLSRSGPDGPWMTVVGVVGAVRQRGLTAAPPPMLYSAFAQRGWDTMDVVVVPDGSRPDVVALTRDRMHALAPSIPIDDLRSFGDLIARSTRPLRLRSLVVAAFGVMAVVVAALGIYTVVAYAAERREHEIGIRMALGATPGSVVRLVLREGGWQVGFGVALGLAGAAALRGLLAGLLFATPPGDPWSFAGVPVFIGVVGLIAMYLPARRSARLNPAHTLRPR